MCLGLSGRLPVTLSKAAVRLPGYRSEMRTLPVRSPFSEPLQILRLIFLGRNPRECFLGWWWGVWSAVVFELRDVLQIHRVIPWLLIGLIRLGLPQFPGPGTSLTTLLGSVGLSFAGRPAAARDVSQANGLARDPEAGRPTTSLADA